jgi:4-aminobutyrate aminotransferase / (S)-3-amino-2-methylpropionate transaminase / 5-aminovalerate transaminase
MGSDNNESPDWDAPPADFAPYLIHNDWVEPVLTHGTGALITDEEGREYIDLEAGPGVASVGHCHPDVVAAIREQAGRLLLVPGRYMGRAALNLARRLADYAGNGLRRTFFCNSGAEAAEGAVKLALKHAWKSGREGYTIIALQHAYHGRLGLSLSLTGLPKMKRGMGSFGIHPGVTHAPAPYCYRCPLGLKYPSCGVKCADFIDEMMDTSVQGEAAVFIGEPILGVGGAITPPPEYWPKVADILRRRGVLFVLDEVFTGFGRTGRAFAHHLYECQPDIMAFAKAIGGGVPIGGFMASDEVGSAFGPADHSTTYGGKNQLGIAAAHAVLDVIDHERLAENAAERGAQFMDGLRALARRFPVLGDVRGRGLFIGVEVVRNGAREPDAALAKAISRETLNQGLLLSPTGAWGNTLRITPPLVISAAQVEQALAALERSLQNVVPTAGRA